MKLIKNIIIISRYNEKSIAWNVVHTLHQSCLVEEKW